MYQYIMQSFQSLLSMHNSYILNCMQKTLSGAGPNQVRPSYISTESGASQSGSFSYQQQFNFSDASQRNCISSTDCLRGSQITNCLILYIYKMDRSIQEHIMVKIQKMVMVCSEDETTILYFSVYTNHYRTRISKQLVGKLHEHTYQHKIGTTPK